MPRLFVYGSLQPGGSHAHVLAGLAGRWEKATIRGRLAQSGWGAHIGYPALILDDQAGEIPGHVLSSEDLAAKWADLDAFEGDDYRRVLAPITLATGEEVEANVYVLRQ